MTTYRLWLLVDEHAHRSGLHSTHPPTLDTALVAFMATPTPDVPLADGTRLPKASITGYEIRPDQHDEPST